MVWKARIFLRLQRRPTSAGDLSFLLGLNGRIGRIGVAVARQTQPLVDWREINFKSCGAEIISCGGGIEAG